MNNEIDPIDIEVDELLKMAKSKKFKPGIYNFCDHWCEKCKETKKCFLFFQEEQNKLRKLFSGKTGDDDETFFDDFRHSLELTRRLIERSMREDGLDPKKVLEEAKDQKNWDDDADRRYDKVRCLIKAREYMREAANFLNDFHKSRLQYYEELGMEVGFDNIKDEIETISWYHTFLPIKVWRVLYEKECCRREKDKHLKKLMKKDLKKFYLLVMKCINKSLKSWYNLAEKRKELSESIKKFLVLIENIKDEFKKEAEKDVFFASIQQHP